MMAVLDLQRVEGLKVESQKSLGSCAFDYSKRCAARTFDRLRGNSFFVNLRRSASYEAQEASTGTPVRPDDWFRSLEGVSSIRSNQGLF